MCSPVQSSPVQKKCWLSLHLVPTPRVSCSAPHSSGPIPGDHIHNALCTICMQAIKPQDRFTPCRPDMDAGITFCDAFVKHNVLPTRATACITPWKSDTIQGACPPTTLQAGPRCKCDTGVNEFSCKRTHWTAISQVQVIQCNIMRSSRVTSIHLSMTTVNCAKTHAHWAQNRCSQHLWMMPRM